MRCLATYPPVHHPHLLPLDPRSGDPGRRIFRPGGRGGSIAAVGNQWQSCHHSSDRGTRATSQSLTAGGPKGNINNNNNSNAIADQAGSVWSADATLSHQPLFAVIYSSSWCPVLPAGKGGDSAPSSPLQRQTKRGNETNHTTSLPRLCGRVNDTPASS